MMMDILTNAYFIVFIICVLIALFMCTIAIYKAIKGYDEARKREKRMLDENDFYL